MRITLTIVLFVWGLSISLTAQTCALQAKEVKPVLPVETQKLYERNLAAAFEEAAKKNNDADSTIWLGRRLAYLGNYRDAIRQYTAGISRFPNDARLYRHRGHRFITLRCFDDAIKDLDTAARLVKGKTDEVEPDGIPNARGVPTSTLQSNIWYHLGLAYYLKGNFEKAAAAYSEAEKVSTSPDMLVATKHWQYMTLRRLGNRAEADKTVASIALDLDIIENGDYYALIKLYQGTDSLDKLLKEFEAKADSTSKATIGYGLGNRFLYHDRKAEAEAMFRQVTAGKQWASFGYIAAEADLKRMN